MTEQTHLIDLDTIVQRPTVKIDDEVYALRHREELSLVEDARVVQATQKVAESDLTTATEDELNDLVKTIDEFVTLLSEPSIPVDKLTDLQKVAILEAWARQYNDAVEGADGEVPTGAPTGAS